MIDPKIQVGHVTKTTITPRLFQEHMAAVLEQIKVEKADKYDEWWAQVCKAEEVCPETE